jgi:Xaa-Pro aminopeptidase
MSINDRISALRKEMKTNLIDAYIIPSTDPHQSEYVAPLWESRKWISGFTGSAGVAVVTKDHAGIWTDSRYFLQAEDELVDSEFELHKVYNQGAPEHEQWLMAQLQKGETVGIDQWMFSAEQVKAMTGRLSSQGIQLNGEHDLIDSVWKDRPTLPTDKIIDHPIKYAGESRTDKLHRLRAKMKELGVLKHLITTLDDIAWLFNIRGSDVSFNPVIISYAIVTLDNALLFMDDSKIPEELKADLESAHIEIHPYNSITSYLEADRAENSILVNKASCNNAIYHSMKTACIQHGDNLVMHMKAVKNETEIAHFKDVMKKDAVALCNLYMWLESEVKNRAVPEAEVATQLAIFRSQQADYYGESFSAIVGYESNGAVVHYRPELDTCLSIENKGMLLLDSGGQYIDGTTDITRTVHFSDPTQEQKTAYTSVLKGHISLAKAKFPRGTMGGQLDILARQHLWDRGLNYLHGTGHGVGFFLNVHEPPQGFAPGLSSRSKTVFVPGMVTSNEPGYYKDGAFGIRIENLVVSVDSSDKGYLEFDTITLFPIATNLIDFNIMTSEEVDWLNQYHQRVLAELTPLLNEAQLTWMEKKCEHVEQNLMA